MKRSDAGNERNRGGTPLSRGRAVFALVIALVGLFIPLVIGARVGNVLGVLPYAVAGSLLGVAVGLLALRLAPASAGTPVMIVALVIAVVVFSTVGRGWQLAVPGYLLGTFAGSALGSGLRHRAWLRSRPRTAPIGKDGDR